MCRPGGPDRLAARPAVGWLVLGRLVLGWLVLGWLVLVWLAARWRAGGRRSGGRSAVVDRPVAVNGSGETARGACAR